MYVLISSTLCRIMDIERLGGVVSQGLIGYATVGVNMTARYQELDPKYPQ